MEKPSTKKPMNVLKTMVFLNNFMKTEVEIERDEKCYENEYGDCEFFDKKDPNYCIECKIQRIKQILSTIKFK